MPFSMEAFLLITGRLSGLFLSAPIFSSRQMPVRIKALLVVGVAAMLSYYIPMKVAVDIISPGYFIAALVVEILIGYTLGFVAYILFAAIQLAGQLMDMQMGFAIVNVVDPQSGMQIPLMGNLVQTLALLTYLAVNGHHYLLQALVQSYTVIPVLGLKMGGAFTELLVSISAHMFVLAVKIAAPIVIAILISDIAMGFIARTVPQMNVFIIGLPLKILVGILALLLLLPAYIWVFKILFDRFFAYLDQMIIIMGM